MKCPNCNVTLLMSERQGVEIDYCPDCRGVWLDKGEIERLAQAIASMSGAAAQSSAEQVPSASGRDNRDDGYDRGGDRNRRKRGGLADRLDFG